ncbi:MAG: hypothetical protein JWM33_461 [Caulobacteraceae bacterium]|nr:hypothetical protein [Caulobacteraceae bacterium]
METPIEVRERWIYLRDLLIDQLGRFESGLLQMHSNDSNISAAAISRLKKDILDFDGLIAAGDARMARRELKDAPPAQ